MVNTYVLAEQDLAAAAVEAVAARLGAVGGDAVADLESRHLGAHGSHDADGLVARDQGELGDELAFMD